MKSLMKPRRLFWALSILTVASVLVIHRNDLFDLLKAAIETTFSGYLPSHFSEAYLSQSAVRRFIIGLFSLMTALLAVIGIPHVVVNTIYLLRDLRKYDSLKSNLSLKDRFIKRQNTVQTQYLNELSLAESTELQLPSPSDTEAVNAILKKVQKEDTGPITSFITRTFEPSQRQMQSALQATLHFYFSFAAFSYSAKFYTHAWNAWFELRTLFPLFYPVLTFFRIVFPHFYSTATSQEGALTYPTRQNGGLRPFWEVLFFWMKSPKKYLIIRQKDLVSVSTDSQSGIQTQSWSKFSKYFYFRALSRIDPTKNRDIKIIQIATRQINNPKAMARAVRSMVTSNLVDKPMELLFLFASYSLIDQGILAPLQQEMFSDTSWFYLSRYVFFNGYLYSVIAGVFSDTWIKLQQDVRNENQFHLAPTGRDQQSGFLKWFLKQTFFNPNNRWWTNQCYTVTDFILPTLKATFVTALLLNLITLGRFDLDLFVWQSLALIFLPLTGLTWKLEQGFELASAWVLRNIPTQLRAHPEVQAYAMRSIASRRLVFNFFYKAWDNVTWNLVICIITMSSTTFGPRAFSRIILKNETPTEWVANSLRKIHNAPTTPPALCSAIIQVDSLLTRNYVDGTHLIAFESRSGAVRLSFSSMIHF
jgi:hypothetical protein